MMQPFAYEIYNFLLILNLLTFHPEPELFVRLGSLFHVTINALIKMNFV